MADFQVFDENGEDFDGTQSAPLCRQMWSVPQDGSAGCRHQRNPPSLSRFALVNQNPAARLPPSNSSDLLRNTAGERDELAALWKPRDRRLCPRSQLVYRRGSSIAMNRRYRNRLNGIRSERLNQLVNTMRRDRTLALTPPAKLVDQLSLVEALPAFVSVAARKSRSGAAVEHGLAWQRRSGDRFGNHGRSWLSIASRARSLRLLFTPLGIGSESRKLMSDLDPLALRDQLNETLARYISTAVPISRERTPKLADHARARIAGPQTTLVKGPFLESLPDFEKGRSLERLVRDGVLSSKWAAFEQTGHDRLYRRQLHTHRGARILRASEDNYLVATGPVGQNRSFPLSARRQAAAIA